MSKAAITRCRALESSTRAFAPPGSGPTATPFPRPSSSLDSLQRSTTSAANFRAFRRPVTHGIRLKHTQTTKQQKLPRESARKKAHAALRESIEQKETSPALETSSGLRDVAPRIDQILLEVEQLGKIETALPEERVMAVLKQCEELAETLHGSSSLRASHLALDETPAHDLLSLSSSSSSSSPAPGQPSTKPTKNPPPTALALSRAAESLIRLPTVFLTPALLSAYTRLHATLALPATLPAILALYASKPVPLASARPPLRFAPAHPARASAAVPPATAALALAAALRARDMRLCLAVVAASSARPAFARAKTLRRALLPAAGGALLAPIAAYVLAQHIAPLLPLPASGVGDVGATANVAFAGLLAYAGTAGTIGFVALTTANDQMERVTWSDGTPLRERWAREDERAMFDQIASAWGFRERERRGDEEGADWEMLRERVASRGMILDRVSLMEGME